MLQYLKTKILVVIVKKVYVLKNIVNVMQVGSNVGKAAIAMAVKIACD
jgi:hypothetical protein